MVDFGNAATLATHPKSGTSPRASNHSNSDPVSVSEVTVATGCHTAHSEAAVYSSCPL